MYFYILYKGATQMANMWDKEGSPQLQDACKWKRRKHLLGCEATSDEGARSSLTDSSVVHFNDHSTMFSIGCGNQIKVTIRQCSQRSRNESTLEKETITHFIHMYTNVIHAY